MKKKEKRAGKERSFREEWHLFARALKIWKELLPGYFPCQFILTGLEVFTPYFGLYMSARLIDGLEGLASNNSCFFPELQFSEDLSCRWRDVS